MNLSSYDDLQKQLDKQYDISQFYNLLKKILTIMFRIKVYFGKHILKIY